MAHQSSLILATLLTSFPALAQQKLKDIQSFKVCGRTYKLEIAKTDADRSRGLMYRTNVPPDEGMVFVFTKPEKQVFWMKNVPIALDILFFDENGRSVNSTTMSPESPLVQDMFLKHYPSDRPSQFVVELREGTLKTFKAAQLQGCRLSPLPKS